MDIIVDKQKQLNYHPLAVYFMLQPSDFNRNEPKIKRLNNNARFTRGVFMFRAFERGKNFYSALTEQLAETLNKHNVILRLVDDIDGNFIYAFGNIDFTGKRNSFESSLESFITGACKENITILKRLQSENTNNPENSTDNISMIEPMINRFTEAMDSSSFTKALQGHISNNYALGSSPYFNNGLPDSMGSSSMFYNDLPNGLTHGHQLPPEIERIKYQIIQGITDIETKESIKALIQFYESHMDIPELKESDKYVQGTIDDTQSQDLKTDLCARKEPANMPNITIGIKQVVSRVYQKKTGDKVVKKWGVEITIDGEPIEIYFGSKDATMVYLCTLLQAKVGARFRRRVFLSTLTNNHNPSPELSWLERVYQKVFSARHNEFAEWHTRVGENSCQAINQGKSNVQRDIRKHLSERFADALFYCNINLDKSNSAYYVNLPSERITIPEELADLLPRQLA